MVKKYGFHGGPKTHGSNFHRRAGSIGQCADPSKVWKNTKMPGHMGNIKKTIRNIQIVNLDKEQNLLLVKGAVPGKNKGIVFIKQKLNKKKS